MLKIETFVVTMIMVLVLMSSWMFWQLQSQQLRFSNAIIPVMATSSQLAADTSSHQFHTSGYWDDKRQILSQRLAQAVTHAEAEAPYLWLSAKEQVMFDQLLDRADIARFVVLSNPSSYGFHDAILSGISRALSNSFRSRMNNIFWIGTLLTVILWMIVASAWLMLMSRLALFVSVVDRAPLVILLASRRVVIYANREAKSLLGHNMKRSIRVLPLVSRSNLVRMTDAHGKRFCAEITYSSSKFVTAIFIRDVTDRVKRIRERQEYIEKLQAVQTMSEALLGGLEKTHFGPASRKGTSNPFYTGDRERSTPR